MPETFSAQDAAPRRPAPLSLPTVCFLLLLWLLTFALGKLAFLALCRGREAVSLGDVAAILWHGLPMDLSTSAYLLVLPWLCGWLSFTFPRWRRLLHGVTGVFHAAASPAVVACILGDIILYPFWGFKLDATIWTYIDSPRDAVASVSTGFVILCLAAFLLATGLLLSAIGLLTGFPPVGKRIPTRGKKDSHGREKVFPRAGTHLFFALSGILLFILLRGGLTESTMNVGNAYFSDRQFLNHAAVNPAFSLLASSQKAEHFDRLYRSMPEEEAWRLVEEAFQGRAIPRRPSPLPLPCREGNSHLSGTEEEASGLMHFTPLPRREEQEGGPSKEGASSSSPFPSILLILWEGCGGQLTSHLGGPTGEKAITPNLDSVASTGVFFSQFHANSFRTDRGVLCALSGQLSYPTHSLMKMTRGASRLPSLARTLQAAGYTTSFTYGGDINFTNMKGYLLATGFQHLTADTDFSRAERATAKWGVCDSVLFLRLYDQIADASSDRTAPFFITALTLSSHEPWDVPASFRRPGDPDERVAAFRYTDHHLGRFLRRLRQMPLWDNLLVVVLPDHGVLAADVHHWQEPRFFHVPMVWTGGAVKPTCTVSAVMNQSDLPATLLGQLGLPHDDFPWSRDVLSPAYTRPFAYATFNDGFAVFAPSSSAPGLTAVFFDSKAQKATTYGDTEQADSLTRLGKAILQCSYDQLQQLQQQGSAAHQQSKTRKSSPEEKLGNDDGRHH